MTFLVLQMQKFIYNTILIHFVNMCCVVLNSTLLYEQQLRVEKNNCSPFEASMPPTA